jgi:hypothetical protein
MTKSRKLGTVVVMKIPERTHISHRLLLTMTREEDAGGGEVWAIVTTMIGLNITMVRAMFPTENGRGVGGGGIVMKIASRRRHWDILLTQRRVAVMSLEHPRVNVD